MVLAGHLTDSAHGHGLLRVDTVRHDAERPPSSVGRVVALIPRGAGSIPGFQALSREMFGKEDSDDITVGYQVR